MYSVSKNVHVYDMCLIVLEYDLFVSLSFDTASHDTAAILLANLGESLQDFQVLVFFSNCVPLNTWTFFSKRTRGRQVLTV